VQMIVLGILLFIFSGVLRNWVVEKLMVLSKLEVGARQATGLILRYTIINIGFIILKTAGIDLTALNVLTGAIGICVGFGIELSTGGRWLFISSMCDGKLNRIDLT
jgi:small-conductance mechanosensitive channel